MTLKHLAFAVLSFIFTACSGDNTITYGGQTYKTVKIGEQTWMAENMNHEAEGSKCYENHPANCKKYGRLYNWETAMKVCPKGWHLPNNADWDKLLRFVDGDKGTKSPYMSTTAGKHLKAISGWNKNGNDTDDYGFFALPGGLYLDHSSFYFVGSSGYWWSASEFDNSADYRRMGCCDEYAYEVRYGSHYKPSLLSVRCIKD